MPQRCTAYFSTPQHATACHRYHSSTQHTVRATTCHTHSVHTTEYHAAPSMSSTCAATLSHLYKGADSCAGDSTACAECWADVMTEVEFRFPPQVFAKTPERSPNTDTDADNHEFLIMLLHSHHSCIIIYTKEAFVDLLPDLLFVRDANEATKWFEGELYVETMESRCRAANWQWIEEHSGMGQTHRRRNS